MNKFRQKPIVVEAIEFRTDNIKQVIEFLEGGILDLSSNMLQLYFERYKYIAIKEGIKIPTLEEVMTASLGDWIIKGISGKFYPCKPDIFEKSYEKVEESEE